MLLELYHIKKISEELIKMISEELFDTEDWFNDAEHSHLPQKRVHMYNITYNIIYFEG